MEDSELRAAIAALNAKMDQVYVSAEKTRKYFLTTAVITLIAFVLPLVGLVFAIPTFLSTFAAIGGIQ